MGFRIGCTVKMTGENTAKKDRDPIFTVCLAIFLVAAVIALGSFVVKEYFPSGDATASTGDTVTVDYVGTYYAAYDEEYAVVFDTNISSIGNDDDIQKSNDWTEKSSYKGLTFKIGSKTMLEGFENAVIGHKVGDTINIYLSASEGYVGPSTEGKMNATGNEIDSTQYVSKKQFSELYPDVKLEEGKAIVFDSKYGFPAQALLTDSGRAVLVTYFPVTGETYEVYKQGETTVSFKANSVGEKLNFDIIIKNPVKVDSDGHIQMIKLELEEDIYITSISGNEITYKTGSEKINEPLFFQIKITNIE